MYPGTYSRCRANWKGVVCVKKPDKITQPEVVTFRAMPVGQFCSLVIPTMQAQEMLENPELSTRLVFVRFCYPAVCFLPAGSQLLGVFLSATFAQVFLRNGLSRAN